jgi:hypothetical protein
MPKFTSTIDDDRPLGLARALLRDLLLHERVPVGSVWPMVAPLDLRQLISLISDEELRNLYAQLARERNAGAHGVYDAAFVFLTDDGRARVTNAYLDARPQFDRNSHTPLDWVRAHYLPGPSRA